MKIQINISDPDSIDKAIQKIKDYRESFKAKVNEIVSRLTELGAQVVDYQYSGLLDQEYEVTCIVKGNHSMIIAEGDSVMFLEFGTGVDTDSEYGESEGFTIVEKGMWSQTWGKGQFVPNEHEHWYYRDVKYEGTKPTYGFMFASKEIKEQGVEIAKKVFRMRSL